MEQEMLPKFDKYWESYNVVLSMAVVLDPRLKMKFVEFCYNKIDASTCDENLFKVRKALTDLFEAYVFQNSDQVPQRQQHLNSTTTHVAASSSFTDDTLDFDNFEECDNSKSELDKYLEEPRYDHRDYPHMDILKFWKDHSGRYLILTKMARDIMVIPITPVASESTFSIG